MATVEHCLYCFEALSATLEKRTPMSLYQVQNSWADYPKGLEDDDDEEEVEPGEAVSPELETTTQKSPITGSRPRIPALSRLSNRRSPSSPSTPSSSSTSSLAPSTNGTTPSPSLSSFSPIGLNPRRTSQRSSTISESPLFVTWNTVSPSSAHRSLRGCIGTFEAQPLSEGLKDYALTSALQDHRFSPISLRELSSLEVSVTLLTDFENAKDAMDWDLGIHGLRISFYARNKRYGACYLPDVAPEQGWDKEETVISLMRKAGWGGKKEKWSEVGDLKVVRFQGAAESVGWDEYKRWRDWVRKGQDKASK